MRIGVIGHGISIERENLDQSTEDLVFVTVKKALRETGLTIEEIDTIVQAGDDIMDGIAINHVYTVEPAGSFLKDESKVERDGAWAVHYAMARLLSGKFRTAMVVAFSKASQCTYSAFSGMSADPFYLRPVGADGDSIAALQANYFMQRTGATEADLAQVARKNRANGSANQSRTMEGETKDFSIDEILKSARIATPITRLTAAYPGDGCVVMILATEEYVKEKKRNAAWIIGVGLSGDAYYPTYRNLSELKHVGLAANKALEMSGRKIGDVNIFELQENYAHQELMLCEALGIAPAGSPQKALNDGAFDRSSGKPVNASGGALSGGIIYASGLARLMEASLQVTGQAGPSQVPGAKTALVSAQAGLGIQSSIIYVVEG
ncbi:MAG: thiolase family protein [Leptospirales bacterium]|nr:thiolase family protein [Leptospirales bacterium]HMZ35842.1 thiolase family protein [Leptospiraceae bacterium]HNN57376.1 thiolase family protein [Leptospiraceae bacterium]HNN76418.1 thiolase family protein [Leptospiraceae bacterium]HQI20019.1 thiolase family protein [Leptospiraceae bacterium]